MTQKQALQLFNDRQIRTAWDDKEEKWYFSIVDVVAVLTDIFAKMPKQLRRLRKSSPEAFFYWIKTYQRLSDNKVAEGQKS